MPSAVAPRRSGLGPGRHVVAAIAVSGFGTWSYNVGIAVYAFDQTHSAGWVAVVTVGRYVPALLLGWLAGRMVDRLPRRGLAVSADVLCAAVMVALAVLASFEAPVWTLTVVAAVSSFLSRVQSATVLALAADVVVESRLARVSALAGGAEAVATAVGSATASAVLLVFAAPNLFLVNAVSFALSALLISGVPALRRLPSRPQSSGPPSDPRALRVFWPLQATRAITAFVYGIDIVLLTVVATRQFNSGASGYGWLLASSGAGGLAAALWSRRHQNQSSTATIATVGAVVYALPLPLFWFTTPVAGLATQAVRGFGCVLVTAAVIGGLQRSVPSSIAGRVFGTTQMLILAGTCLGAIAAPAVLEVIGFHGALVVFAIVAASAQCLVLPGLLRFDRRGASLLAALEPRLTTLRRLDLFQDATRAMLYAIANEIDELTALPGHRIVQQGGAPEALFVLVSGRVDVTADSGAGPIMLRAMTAPDHFGEIGLIRGVPRTATVTATEQCVLWRIPAQVFLTGVSEAQMSGALTDTIHVRSGTTPHLARSAGEPGRPGERRGSRQT